VKREAAPVNCERDIALMEICKMFHQSQANPESNPSELHIFPQRPTMTMLVILCDKDKIFADIVQHKGPT
jgi:hypothetical protein